MPALPGNEPGTDCKPEDLLPLDLQLSHIHALDYTHHPNHEQWHCPRWAGNTFKREQEMGVRKENDHVSFTLSKPANPRLPPQHQESRHASPASPHRGTLMMMTQNRSVALTQSHSTSKLWYFKTWNHTFRAPDRATLCNSNTASLVFGTFWTNAHTQWRV